MGAQRKQGTSKRRHGQRGPDRGRRGLTKALTDGVTGEQADNRRMGRPPKPINWEMVEHLLSIGCTDREVAAGVGVDYNTLNHPGVNRDTFSALKEETDGRIELSIRRAMISLVQGRRQVMRDGDGHPVKDSKGELVYHVVMPDFRVLFHATRYLSKQYLTNARTGKPFSERTDVTSGGDKLPPGVAPGVLTIVVKNDED